MGYAACETSRRWRALHAILEGARRICDLQLRWHWEEFCLQISVPGSVDVWTDAQVVQNTFEMTLGAQIVAMVRGYSRYRLNVNWGVRLVDRSQAEHLFEDVCKLLLKELLAEDPLCRLDD